MDEPTITNQLDPMGLRLQNLERAVGQIRVAVMELHRYLIRPDRYRCASPQAASPHYHLWVESGPGPEGQMRYACARCGMDFDTGTR